MTRKQLKKLLAAHIISYLELNDHQWIFETGAKGADFDRLKSECELMADWMRKKYRLPLEATE